MPQRFVFIEDYTNVVCRDTVSEIFEPVVIDILRLIRDQVQSVRLKNETVKVRSSSTRKRVIITAATWAKHRRQSFWSGASETASIYCNECEKTTKQSRLLNRLTHGQP